MLHMNAQRYAYLTLFMAALLITGFLAPPTQAQPGIKPLPASVVAEARAELRAYHAWVNARWTDDDGPYQGIRNQIDQALAGGQKPNAIIKKYETVRARKPADAQSLFGLGYICYVAGSLSDVSRDEVQRVQDDLYVAASNKKAHLPHTYNYTRLLFISDSIDLPDPKLKDLGKRLLARDPSDYDVEYHLANDLTFSDEASDRAQAVAYQKDLARRFPNDPRQYRLLGVIYYRVAWLNHNPADVEKCVAAYRRYIDSTSGNREDRARAELNIKFIRNLQAQWSKRG